MGGRGAQGWAGAVSPVLEGCPWYRRGVPVTGVHPRFRQVIGGAGLDVDFSLESPSGLLLVSESRRSDGAHT